MQKKIITLASFAGLAAMSSFAHATPVADAFITASDGYGPAVKVYGDNYINGNDTSSGTNVVSTYFTFDSSKVYGAVHLDSGASAFPEANIYFYSGSLNSNATTGQPGSYGDGNDIIAEGTAGWGFALNDAPYISGHAAYTAGSVNYVSNHSDTVEFSIDRSLLGNYSSFRFGGQLFAYEFHTGGDRVDGALVSVTVPEPTTLAALAGAGLLALRRRRA